MNVGQMREREHEVLVRMLKEASPCLDRPSAGNKAWACVAGAAA